MIDSSISQSRHVEVERDLERWVPDEDDPQCPESENIFDDPRNRLLPFWFLLHINNSLIHRLSLLQFIGHFLYDTILCCIDRWNSYFVHLGAGINLKQMQHYLE